MKFRISHPKYIQNVLEHSTEMFKFKSLMNITTPVIKRQRTRSAIHWQTRSVWKQR